MAVFRYSAVDVDASTVAGTVIADTPRQARDDLRGRGLTVAEIAAVGEPAAPGLWERRRGQLAQSEVDAFVRELATLLGAGIPLLAAVDTLIRQHRGRFRTVLQGLRDRIASGSSLTEAMGARPAYFDELSRSIVRVGESTGTLETVLARLAEFREKAHRLRSRLVTALVYPAVVCVIGAAVATFLMTYVVPQLIGTLEEAGRTLPLATRLVKDASDLLLGWWWALLLAAALAVTGLKLLRRTARGRLALDRLVLALPLVGDVVRKENTSRMAVIMASLLRAGVHFDEAVRITGRTLRSAVFRRTMETYELAIVSGSDIAGPLEASRVFSPLVIQMLVVGQQAGQLEDMLAQLAEAYDQQVATATQRLTAMLEPLLIVLLAVVVGFVAFATILPILEVSDVL
ncbi:MAG: type II secretion system F family protein [Planctomycetota bacterium]|nr:type II secretion system F family protein [Planctomycetota bacterium]